MMGTGTEMKMILGRSPAVAAPHRLVIRLRLMTVTTAIMQSIQEQTGRPRLTAEATGTITAMGKLRNLMTSAGKLIPAPLLTYARIPRAARQLLQLYSLMQPSSCRA